MMNLKTQKAAASLVLLSLTLSSSLSFAQTSHSMHDPSLVADSIVNYLENYQKVQAQNTQAPQPGESASEWMRKWNNSRAGTIISSLLKGDLEKLSEQIAGLGNQDSKTQQLVYWLRGLVSDVSNLNPQVYDDTISRLLADYYENPQNREALFDLLSGVSDRLKAMGAVQPNPHRYWEAAAQGTMTAWTLLTLWNWRGGKSGIARDGKKLYSGLGRGIGWISEQLRTRFRSGNTQAAGALATTNAADWVGATGAQLPLLVQDARTANQASEAKKDIAVILQQDWKNPGKTADGIKQVSKTWLRKFTGFVRDLGASAIVGGSAYALYEWNLSTATVKIDPLLPLELIQAYSVFNLEAKALGLKASLVQRTSDPAIKLWVNLYIQSPIAAERQLQGIAYQLQQLKLEYAHLARRAPQFRANIPLPQNNSIPDAYSGSEQNRVDVMTFIQHSKRLKMVAERMRSAPASSVSLNPVELHIADMEQLLNGMETRLRQLQNLEPEDIQSFLRSPG